MSTTTITITGRQARNYVVRAAVPAVPEVKAAVNDALIAALEGVKISITVPTEVAQKFVAEADRPTRIGKNVTLLDKFTEAGVTAAKSQAEKDADHALRLKYASVEGSTAQRKIKALVASGAAGTLHAYLAGEDVEVEF